MVPSDKLKGKLDYLYGPYNGFYNMHKHMKFDEKYELTSVSNNWDVIKETIMQRDQSLVRYFHHTVHNFKDAKVLLDLSKQAALNATHASAFNIELAVGALAQSIEIKGANFELGQAMDVAKKVNQKNLEISTRNYKTVGGSNSFPLKKQSTP